MRVIIDLLKSILDKVKTISEGGGGGSHDDIVDTVWHFNDTLVAGDLNYPFTAHLDMSGSGILEIEFANVDGEITVSMDNEPIYDGGWTNEMYQTWWITGGPGAYDSDFADWVKLNATQVKDTAYGSWTFSDTPTPGDLTLPATFSVTTGAGTQSIEITSNGSGGIGTISLINSDDPDNPWVIYAEENSGWDGGKTFQFVGGEDLDDPEFIAWLQQTATKNQFPNYSEYDLVYRVNSANIDSITTAIIEKGSFNTVKEKFASGGVVNVAVFAFTSVDWTLEAARRYCVQGIEFSIYDGDEQIVTDFTAATTRYPSTYVASSSGGTVNKKVSLFGAEANVAKPLRHITLTANNSALVY